MAVSWTAARSRFERLVATISYPGLHFEVTTETVDTPMGPIACGLSLRVACPEGTCNVVGTPLAWSGRKWRLSPHMTDMEVVNTAFLALMTALEHEARERFCVAGVALMDSHRDLAGTLAFMAGGGGGNGRAE